MGYSKNAIAGSGWNGLVKVLTMVAIAAKMFVLFRLLTPYDFGLAQYVLILIGALEAFTETGINTTIVQSQNSIHYFLDTAWVISIFRGLVMSIVTIILGFFMSSFFHEDKLLLLTAVASFLPLIRGFINPAIVTWYKEMSFFKDSVYRFSLVFVDTVTAIVCAFLFHSVFIFVYAMIASAIFEVAISFLLLKHKPRFCLIRSRATEIMNNARGLNISAILGYLVENIDNVMVGKIAGTVALGIYSNGYNLSDKFSLELAKSVQYGTFPVYVRIAEQKQRLKKVFWRATILSLAAFIVISSPFLLFPRIIILVFAGQKWIDVVPILPPLVMAGLIQSFIAISTALFTATKNYRWLNISLFVDVLALVVLISIFGSMYGLIGCAYGVLVARVIVLPFALVGIWRSFEK